MLGLSLTMARISNCRIVMEARRKSKDASTQPHEVDHAPSRTVNRAHADVHARDPQEQWLPLGFAAISLRHALCPSIHWKRLRWLPTDLPKRISEADQWRLGMLLFQVGDSALTAARKAGLLACPDVGMASAANLYSS